MTEKSVKPDPFAANRTALKAESEVRALLVSIAGTDAVRREESLRTLKAMGDEGVTVILRMLRGEEMRRNVGYRLSGLVIIGCIAVVALMGHHSMTVNEPAPLMIFPVVGCFIALLFLARFLLAGRLEKSARAALACLHNDLRDPAAIGPLLDAYGEYKDPRLNLWNSLALTRLLPNAPQIVFNNLNERQKVALRKILSTAASVHAPDDWRHGQPEKVNLLLAALSAVKALNDQDAAISVGRLAQEHQETEAQKQVVQAANDCLKSLRSRKEQQQKRTPGW
jgi:hypothetical protein